MLDLTFESFTCELQRLIYLSTINISFNFYLTHFMNGLEINFYYKNALLYELRIR